jgi:hypothetical protein
MLCGIGKLFFHQHRTNSFPRRAAWNHLQPGGVNSAESLLEISMFKTVTVAVCPVASLALSGCASRRGNAMLMEGTIGAGGGALLGAVAGFNPPVRAAIGAAIGAATH